MKNNNTIKFIILIMLVFAFTAEAQSTTASPFFLVGNGKLKIKNVHNGRVADVTYLNKDGTLNDEAFKKIDYVFGFPSEQKGENISRRLIGMIDYFVDQISVDQMVLMNSGYRSPEYNQSLRDKGKTAAKTSTHIDGMALDFYLEGRGSKEAHALWEKIRHMDCCGVGHYGGKSIHLDAGRPRFWEQATSKVYSKEPNHNRFLYYTTEYDRYKAGEKIRTFLTSISDFGFGIKNKLTIVTADDAKKTVSKIKIASSSKDKCLLIRQRKDSRFIYANLPDDLPKGQYRVRVEFCKRPFEDMPEFKDSNPIEINAAN